MLELYCIYIRAVFLQLLLKCRLCTSKYVLIRGNLISNQRSQGEGRNVRRKNNGEGNEENDIKCFDMNRSPSLLRNYKKLFGGGES